MIQTNALTHDIARRLLVAFLAAPLVLACGPSRQDLGRRSLGFRVADGYLSGSGGVQLYYRLLGSGSDTVVVVHGGPGAGMGAILPHVAPLADDRVLLFYDQRGGGRSELPEDTTLLTGRHHVDDLEAVRKHFGQERLSLIAHSFGGILAAEYAATHPEAIERMVFVKATGPERDAARAVATSPFEQGDSATVDSLFTVMRKLLRGEGSDPVALCREYERLGGELARQRGEPSNWRGTTCEMPPEAVRYYYRYTAQLGPRSFGSWNFTDRLGEVEAPVLVLHGAADTAGLAAQRAWASAFPGGRLLLVPEARGTIADRPEFVIEVIEEFLGGEWPEGATAVP